MTDLRKLLIEAREYVDAYIKRCDTIGGIPDAHKFISRIDAALAEKVEPVACRHEPYQGFCAHCNAPYVNGRAVVDSAPAAQWRRVEDGLPDEVVGHKTFIEADGMFRHEPLTRGEADKCESEWQSAEKRRNELMPDEHSAISMFWDAHYRLKNFGWNDACYCPKDGSSFLVIEAGSTGQHVCTYQGEWPKGSYWIQDPELGPSPSRPVLFKPLPALPEGDK